MSIQFNPLIFSGLDLTGSGSAGSVEWREPVANEASLPLVGNLNGEARVTLDTDKIYVWDETSARWVDTGITSAGFGSSPNAQGQTIGTDDSTPNIRRRTLALQPADATNPGGVSTASQSFAGAKTFLDQVKIDEASNQLVLGTNKTTTLNAPNPTTNRVVTIPDAGADSSVVLTESAQTINGAKTFSATVNTDGGIDVTATAGTDTLTIGGSNADVVNIGRSGTTVNIVGTTINQIVTNLNVTDKNITLNSGGAAGSGATSGIDVEENGAITGYVEVSGNRNSWELKAPNTAGIATITPGASGITIDQSSHDPVSLAAVGSSSNSNGASLSGQQLTLQPANATNPGVLTSGTQTIGGNKTFVDLLKSQTGLALEDPGVGTQSVTIQAPSLSSSYTLTLPTDDGVQYQFLQTDGNGALSFDYSKFSNAHYHVSSDGRSEYPSIQAAINAAEAAGACYATPKFVFVHGVFTEDLTISKTGIFLIGEDSQLNQLTRINGSLTFNKLSNTPDAQATLSLVYISSIFFNKASDNFVRVTGTNPQRIHFQDCFFYASSNSVFLADNTGTNSKVTINNCYFLAETNPAKVPLTISAGWVDVRNSVINQNAGSGSSAVLTDSALLTVSNTEINGTLTFTQTSYGFISSCSISTVSGSAIATTSTNPLGVGIINSGLTVPAATSSVTGTGYLYHSNNTNGGLGGGFAATVAAIGLTSDTGNIRLPNRGTITLSESLLNGQNTLTITPPASVASNLTYTVPDVGANADFVMTQGTQTIAGAKTFSTAITGEINYVPADSGDWALPVPSLISSAVDQLADKKIGNVASLGTGETLVGAPVGTTANIKSLVAGTNVSFTSDANSVTINASGSGTITGGSNLGTGEGVYASVVGSNLNFKSLKAGTNVTVSSDANEITINASGGSSLTLIPDGGTLTGDYYGDVGLQGGASLTGNVRIYGNLFGAEDPTLRTLNTQRHRLLVTGDVTLPYHYLVSTTDVGANNSLEVSGSATLYVLDLSGLSSSPNAGSATIQGDLTTSQYINLSGYGGVASGNGGNLTVYGQINTKEISLYGGSASSAAGSTAGNGGTLLARDVVCEGIFSADGGTSPAGAGTAGGNASSSILVYGDFVCGDRISCSGGRGDAAGGNSITGNGFQVGGDIICRSLYLDGGQSSSGSGGTAGTVFVSGDILFNGGGVSGVPLQLRASGGDGTTGGAGGSITCRNMNGIILGVLANGGLSSSSGNGGNGGSISCSGDLSLNTDGNSIQLAGGNSVSGNGGSGGSIKARKIQLTNASGIQNLISIVHLSGGSSQTGSGGNGGLISAIGEIFCVYQAILSGGSNTAGGGGSAGTGGTIEYGQKADILGGVSLVGGNIFNNSVGTPTAGSGGRIRAIFQTGLSTTVVGEQTFNAANQSINVSAGTITRTLSSDVCNSGNGGTIVTGSLYAFSISGTGSSNNGTGSGGSGALITCRGNIFVSGSVTLTGGGAFTNGGGGQGGSISCLNDVSLVGSFSASGGQGNSSGNGGSAGSISASGALYVSGSATLSGGNAGGTGNGGGGGAIIAVKGVTILGTTAASGGNSVNGSGGGAGSIIASAGDIVLSTATLSGGALTSAFLNKTSGSGGLIRAAKRILLTGNFTANGGSITQIGAANLSSGAGGTIRSENFSSTAGGAGELILAPSVIVSLSGGSISANSSGTHTVGAGGVIYVNDFNMMNGSTVVVSGGSISGTTNTSAPGRAGQITIAKTFVMGSSALLSLIAGTGISTTTAASSSASTGLQVFGASTLNVSSVINSTGSTSLGTNGSGGDAPPIIFYGNLTGKGSINVTGGNGNGIGTVGRSRGVLLYGGASFVGSIVVSDGSGGTAPSNLNQYGGVHVSGTAWIDTIQINPFSSARASDMTIVCDSVSNGASSALFTTRSLTYSAQDGTGSITNIVFRGVAGAAISSNEAVSELTARHTYTFDSTANTTWKQTGAPV